MKEVEKPVNWGTPLMDWFDANLGFAALSKEHCVVDNCTNAPADGSHCAVHSPLFNEDAEEFRQAMEEWEEWKRDARR